MVDHHAILLAVRARLLGLIVAETVAPVVPTPAGFSRANGSFLDEGFIAGLEIVPAYAAGEGTPVVITDLSTLSMTVLGAVDQVQVPVRISSGLPEMRGWENVAFDPLDQRWYVEEDFLPGSSSLVVGNYGNGEMDNFPTYVLRLYGLAGRGSAALYRVADAILASFPPGSILIATPDQTVRVRGMPMPFKDQLLPEGSSHAMIEITVPFWARARTP